MHFTGFVAFLADAAPAAGGAGQPGSQNIFGMLPFFALMFVIMYFVLIRPQNLQRKQQAKLQESLKGGDRVVTASGIVGTVISVKDKTVSLRSMDAKMEVTRSSVIEVIERAGDDKSEKPAS